MNKQPITAREVATQVFAVCESFEDEVPAEGTEPQLERFMAGKRFAAKQIRRGIGTWLTDQEGQRGVQEPAQPLLTSEVLRQHLAAEIPGFLAVLAPALGYTVSDLLAAVERGEVSTTRALLALGKALTGSPCDIPGRCAQLNRTCDECDPLPATWGGDPSVQDQSSTEPDPDRTAELTTLLRRIEPHLSAIVCYASTCGEHEPNQLAVDVRKALAGERVFLAPFLFVSPAQAQSVADDDDTAGNYIPVRRKSAGMFTMPLYVSPHGPSVAWMRAIDEAMVAHHVGVADVSDTYFTAKYKLNLLLKAAEDIGALHERNEPKDK